MDDNEFYKFNPNIIDKCYVFRIGNCCGNCKDNCDDNCDDNCEDNCNDN